ncbi:hypothetical protein EVC45_43015 [Paraburkholderia sp. UYCP14C]|uniref:hypothetical protein n=1 Tax=Paraburkholderia sp. UYCP14C TaxID=2511130 RepID=UPI001020C323|nr:hypothetical protein [Paraburkholderia sp. UYCP14C]RZF23676.1 hypothetical protein EVC45_43015 [Paraburkholderia sp. UYCP14C]
MHDDAPTALPQDAIELRAWLSDWYDHAFNVGYIHPPFTLDEATADRLEGYFKAGLTPAEGAMAFFGSVH